MKLLANENFPLASVRYLRSKGFDVLSIGTDHTGVTDEIVMAIAIKENRAILTFDRDYGELIFKHGYRPVNGVIYLRLDEFSPDEPGKIIEELIQSQEITFENTFTVLDRQGVRQRNF